MKPNIAEPQFYKTPELPQPYTYAYGGVTTTGAPSTTRPFLPKRITVVRNSVGNYTVKHNFTNLKYYAIITPESQVAYSVTYTATTFTVTFPSDTNFFFEIRGL